MIFISISKCVDWDCLIEDAFDSKVWIGAVCGSDVHANSVYIFGSHTSVFPYIYFG